MATRAHPQEHDSLLGTGRATQQSRPFSPNIFVVLGISLGVALLLFESFIVIPPGEIGIVVTLGHASVFTPGAHFRTPVVSYLKTMSTKTQLLEQENTIPTKEGLSVRLDTAVLYRLDVSHAANLFKTVGVDYRTILIEPESASAIRGLTSESEAKALYTSGRTAMQEILKEDLVKSLGPRGIIVEDVLLKDVKLPEELSKSIELKAKAEQDAARMQFVLQKEKQEAERKTIEAQGIANFQNIVSEGISPNLLKWKGIEATEKFASSTNTKIVLMGNGKDGLPVLFSADGDIPM